MQDDIKTHSGREKLFLRLYELSFPDVAAFIRQRGGAFDDARDIFQDSLVVYYEKTVASGFSPVRNEKAYLMGIAKNLWFRKLKEETGFYSLSEGEEAGEGPEEHASRRNILNFLEQTGRKCMDILKAFYYDKLNMQEMADNFGFGSVRSATVQKYKCLEKVREKVKEKSLYYEDFIA